jgi:drug/metabolite transporter (DMT)-like permease
MTEIRYSLLLVFATLISSVSQVLLKKSADKTYKNRIQEYLNPLVFSAYFIFFISAVMTMVSYKVVTISTGAMLESSSYVFVFLFDRFLFQEKVNSRKILAVVMIIIGVVVAAG